MRQLSVRGITTIIGSVVLFSIPYVSSAASIFTGSIVPAKGTTCYCLGSAPSFGCVLQVLQSVMNAAVGLGVLFCVLWIVYAGFSMMTSGSEAEAKSMAKTRLLNAVIGILVILSAWLIVDFVMKTVYNQDTVYKSIYFGPWNSILAPNGNDYCLQENKNPQKLTDGFVDIVFNSTNSTQGPIGTYSTGTGTGSCNPSTVAQAAAAGGYNLTSSQANTLACLARPESSCGSNTTGARTTAGSATSAAGPWQNLLGASDKCHSLNISACGNLNCSAAYSGGKVKNDAASKALAAQCQAAISTLKCSSAAAACLIQNNGNKFSAWTADSRSSAQKACVTGNGERY